MACNHVSDLEGLSFRICADELIGTVADLGVITNQWTDSAGGLIGEVSTSSNILTGSVIFHENVNGSGHAGVRFTSESKVIKFIRPSSDIHSQATMIIVATGEVDSTSDFQVVLTAQDNTAINSQSIWYWDRDGFRASFWQSTPGTVGYANYFGPPGNDELQVANVIEIWATRYDAGTVSWHYSHNTGTLGGSPSYAWRTDASDDDDFTPWHTNFRAGEQFVVGGFAHNAFPNDPGSIRGFVHEILFYTSSKTSASIQAICEELDIYYANELTGTPTVFINAVSQFSVDASTSAFVSSSAPPATGSHTASQWQITTLADTTFASPVYDPGDDAVNLVSITNAGSGSLSTNTSYMIRARHKENPYSLWSSPVSFVPGLSAQLTASVGAEFWWQVQSGSNRQGVYINATSGSPPLSLEPVSGSPSVLMEGDIWYEASGTTSDGNLYIGQPGPPAFADLLLVTPSNITSLPGYSFTGPAGRTYVDANGIIQTAASGELRNSHYNNGVRSIKLEGASTNELPESEDVQTSWAVGGTPILTPNDAVAPDGTTTADKIEDDNAVSAEQIYETITVANDSTEWTFSTYVKKTVGDSFHVLRARFTGGTELNYQIGFNTADGASTVTGSPDTPTGSGVESISSTWWRVWVTGPNNGSGNTTCFPVIYGQSNTVVSTTILNAPIGSLHVWGMQLENKAFPTSYIPTAGTAVTRNADSLSVDFTAVPQEMTVYVKGVERGSKLVGGLWTISDAGGNTPTVKVINNGGTYRMLHVPSGAVMSVNGTAPDFGDNIEENAVLFSDGAVQLLQSINSGAVEDTTKSAPLALISPWSGQTLRPNFDGGSQGYFDFESIRIATGVQSMENMRSRAIIINRFVTVRDDEPDIASVISRWATADAPVDIYIGANAVITDEGFVTVNTSGSSGTLVRNDTWGDGFYMPDASTISLLGISDFLVPTGTLQIDSGSLYVYSGSIFMNGPGSMFDISGSGISASLLGNPIVSVLTGSVATSSLFPVPIDGTFYVNTGSSAVSLRADGTFYTFGGGIPDPIDGGTY